MPLSTPRTDSLLLEIGEKSSLVRLDLWDATLSPISLTFGIRAIQPEPFRHAPPTPLELERAIMVVEDELMRIAPRIPSGVPLAVRSLPSLAPVLGAHQLSREHIELIFGQLAAMVEGDPLAASQLPRDDDFAATLLIIREWLHHLASDSVILIE
ncbi:hypothetical protein [Aeromonas enteropelogenes]|uniref:hypothetical protein n=1 Tax=Aeromonas enteropelogenes TaxID=29489 RepID=UPI0039857DEB